MSKSENRMTIYVPQHIKQRLARELPQTETASAIAVEAFERRLDQLKAEREAREAS